MAYETWLPLAETADVLLAFAADPWWARITRRKDWDELQKRLRALDEKTGTA